MLGVLHEAGHVLQMQPQMTWGGLTEVRCNIARLFELEDVGHTLSIRQEIPLEKAK